MGLRAGSDANRHPFAGRDDPVWALIHSGLVPVYTLGYPGFTQNILKKWTETSLTGGANRHQSVQVRSKYF